MASAPLNGAALNGRGYTQRPVAASAGFASTGALGPTARRIVGGRSTCVTAGVAQGSGTRVRRSGAVGLSTSLVAIAAPWVRRWAYGGVSSLAVLAAVVPQGRSASCMFAATASLSLSIQRAAATVAASSSAQAAATRCKYSGVSAASTSVATARPRQVFGAQTVMTGRGFLDPKRGRATLTAQSSVTALAGTRVASVPVTVTSALLPSASRRHGGGVQPMWGYAGLVSSAAVNLNPITGLFIYTASHLRSQTLITTRADAPAIGVVTYLADRVFRGASAQMDSSTAVSCEAQQQCSATAELNGDSGVFFLGAEAPVRIAGGSGDIASLAFMELSFIPRRMAESAMVATLEASGESWVTQGAEGEVVSPSVLTGSAWVTCQAQAAGILGLTAVAGSCTRQTPAPGLFGAAMLAPSAIRTVRSTAPMVGVSSARAFAFINFATRAPAHRTAYVKASPRGLRIPAETRRMRV